MYVGVLYVYGHVRMYKCMFAMYVRMYVMCV